jgi:hypothetical protein
MKNRFFSLKLIVIIFMVLSAVLITYLAAPLTPNITNVSKEINLLKK